MDERLINEAIAGSREAFAALYGAYRDRLYRYALYRLGSPEEAEDAVSECVLAAWKGIGSLRNSRAFGIVLCYSQRDELYYGWIQQLCRCGGVWAAAETVGYGSLFSKEEGNAITDDHLPLNRVAGIPCIDIIPHYPDCEASSFGPTWHTVNDDMQHIDRNTLQAVGQTMIQVLFSEN